MKTITNPMAWYRLTLTDGKIIERYGKPTAVTTYPDGQLLKFDLANASYFLVEVRTIEAINDAVFEMEF